MKGRDKLSGHPGRFSRRALLIGGAQAGLFALLGWRLYRLQFVEGQKYALLADENRINVQLVAPTRGVILDRFGEPLATNAESLRVLVVPDRAPDLEATLDRLATVIDLGNAARDRALRLARRQTPHIPILVAENLSWHEFAQVNVMAPSLPGVETDRGWVRRYRHGADMAHIVGYVGAADSNEVRGDPVTRLPGFRIGKTGVERGFDARLRGRAGNVKLEVNAYGRGVRTLGRAPGEEGRSLVLTVDHRVQRFALQRLSEHRRASVVAMAVETGDILAMASTPSFDPNPVVSGLTDAHWESLLQSPDHPLSNKVIRGIYPPGSTFKMVTALAGLEAGEINPSTSISCGGGYAMGRAYFRCWRRRGHGPVDLHRSLKESCDVYYYETAKRLGIERLAAMARKLGFGQTYDCGLPLQRPGVVPDPAWKGMAIGEIWYPGETVIAGIGQGYVSSNPLQLAVMTARLASGRKIVPRVVLPEPGEPVPRAEPLDLNPYFLRLVRAGMSAVVNEQGGTAVGSRLPGDEVRMAGKTGTSQVVSARASRQTLERLGWEAEHHALFVGYAPDDAPRYAVAAVVEHGGGGSRAAAPIVRDVMLELLQRDPLSRPPYEPDRPTQRADIGPEAGQGS